MRRSIFLVVVPFLTLCLASRASAEDIVLANGDVVRGTLQRQGDGWVLHHDVLGDLSLPADAVRSSTQRPLTPTALARTLAQVPAPAERLERSGECADAWLTAEDCGCQPKDPCTGPWSGSVGLGLSLQSGNTDKFDILADVKVAYEKGASKASFAADYNYGESEGAVTADHWHGSLRYDHAINPLSYAFAQVLYQSDELADLDYRLHGLVGYGRKVYRTKVSELKVEAGGGMVWEQYRGRGQTSDPSAYIGADYCHTWADGSKLNAGLDYLPNLNDYDLTSINFDAKYSKPLSGKLDLVIGLRLEYTVAPPNDLDNTDLFLTAGIRVKF